MDIKTNAAPDRPMQMLVVDDDEDLLALLTATVKTRFGATIHLQAVNDPRIARDVIESSLVDILVTDLEMPNVSGLQLLRCAKRRNAWTQVIVITGHSFHDALTDAMDLGASDYLVKPLEPTELDDVLTEACARLCRWRRSLARTLLSTSSQRTKDGKESS